MPYITWNPADKALNIILSNSNLTAGSLVNGWLSVRATQGKSNGKFYFEFINAGGDLNNYMVGLMTATHNLGTYFSGNGGSCWGWRPTGIKIYNGAQTGYGSAASLGDVIGLAADLDAGKIWFAVNNAWIESGNPETGANPSFTGIVGPVYPSVALYATNERTTAQFRRSVFSYDPPQGYEAYDTLEPIPISGNATKSAGGGVDRVLIRDWVTGAFAGIAIPASNGDWTTGVEPGQYDITYFAADCQPICHGPYTVTAD